MSFEVLLSQENNGEYVNRFITPVDTYYLGFSGNILTTLPGGGGSG